MLSLPTLAHLVAFLPEGAPLAFVAASPTARIAAETFRAEENYTWTSDGLETRPPGARETFNVYEARRATYAGVRIGPMVVVYHDSTGILSAESCCKLPLPKSAAKGPVLSSGDAKDGDELMVGVIHSEYEDASLFPNKPTAGNHQWQRIPLLGSALLSNNKRTCLEAAQGNDVITLNGADGTSHRVHYYSGPNRRSVYLWMDAATEANKETTGDFASSASLATLLRVTQWWLQRPSVSSLAYLLDPVYATATSVPQPPPPPALYLHLYGRKIHTVPQVCSAFILDEEEEGSIGLTSDETSSDMAAEANTDSGALVLLNGSSEVTATKRKGKGSGARGRDSQNGLDRLFGCAAPNNTFGGPSNVFLPSQSPREGTARALPTAVNAELAATSLDKDNECGANEDVINVLVSIRPVDETVTDAIVTNGGVEKISTKVLSRRIQGTVLPALEGLFIVSHPMMEMRMTGIETDTGPSLTNLACCLHSDVVSRLKILKVNGVYVDDAGLQGFFLGGSGPQQDPNSTAHKLIIPRTFTSAMPFLEMCDVGFSRELSVFPAVTLLEEPKQFPCAALGHSMFPHLRFLSHLNLQCTNIGNDVVVTVAAASPNLQSLSLASCAHVSDINALAPLRALWRLDVHSTAINNAGIASFAHAVPLSSSPGLIAAQLLVCPACSALEELSLAGCTSLTDVTALGGLFSLRKVDLRGVAVREGLDALRSCPWLRELLLGYTGTTEDQAHWAMLEATTREALVHLQTLRGLTLDNGPYVTASALESIAASRAPLQVLRLAQVPHLRNLGPLGCIGTLKELSVAAASTALGRGNRAVAVPTAEAEGENQEQQQQGEEGKDEDYSAGLEHLAHCTSLKRVTLHACEGLRDFNALATVPQLTYLDISGNCPDVTEENIGAFGQYTPPSAAPLTIREQKRLRKEAAHPNGTDASRATADLPLETFIIAGYAKLADLGFLGSLRHLKTLDASRTGVTVAGLAGLGTAPALEHLYLAHCSGLTNINALAQVTSLRVLDLTATPVTDAGVADLSRLPLLETLLLTGCTALEFKSPMAVFRALRVLSLTGASQLTDARLKQWCVLDISCPEKEEDFLYSPFPQLAELDLSLCSRVTSIAPLLTLPRLLRLHLRGTRVRSESMIHLPELPTLRYLDVRDVTTVDALVSLFMHRQLREIDMRGFVLANPEKEQQQKQQHGLSQESGSEVGRRRSSVLQLPPIILAADSQVEELLVSGAAHVQLLWPLLEDRHALPRLRVLQLVTSSIADNPEMNDADETLGTMEAITEKLRSVRPLLSVRRV